MQFFLHNFATQMCSLCLYMNLGLPFHTILCIWRGPNLYEILHYAARKFHAFVHRNNETLVAISFVKLHLDDI